MNGQPSPADYQYKNEKVCLFAKDPTLFYTYNGADYV